MKLPLSSDTMIAPASYSTDAITQLALWLKAIYRRGRKRKMMCDIRIIKPTQPTLAALFKLEGCSLDCRVKYYIPVPTQSLLFLPLNFSRVFFLDQINGLYGRILVHFPRNLFCILPGWQWKSIYHLLNVFLRIFSIIWRHNRNGLKQTSHPGWSRQLSSKCGFRIEWPQCKWQDCPIKRSLLPVFVSV